MTMPKSAVAAAPPSPPGAHPGAPKSIGRKSASSLAMAQQCCSKKKKTVAAAMAAANTVAARTFALPRLTYTALYVGFALGMAFQYLLLELAIIRGDAFLFPALPEAVTMAVATEERDSEKGEYKHEHEHEHEAKDARDMRWEGRRRTWEDVRANLLGTYEYCRMPDFVNEDRPKIYLSRGLTFGNKWRERAKKASLTRQADHRSEFMKERRARRRRRQLEEQRKRRMQRQKNNEKTNKSDGTKQEMDWSNLTKEITYVHVGKAGGSSSSCNVRKAFPTVKKHCDTKSFPADGPLESAISRQVDCYTHYNNDMHCYDVNKSFIINTRNPVHRIMSWYLYEHLWNEPWTHPGRAKENPRCGVLMISTCFGSLDELATVGLSGPPPPRDTRLRVGSDLTPKECSQWAWAAVRGDVPATYHNVWNYDWYASRILEDDSSEIFNLRVEHNDYDWRTIDRMVGGTGDPLPDGDNPKNVAADKEELPLTNKTVSEEGVRNLCRALCEEIQVYKRLLTRAVNLNEDDVRASMEELRKTCPEETDVAPRDCGQR